MFDEYFHANEFIKRMIGWAYSSDKKPKNIVEKFGKQKYIVDSYTGTITNGKLGRVVETTICTDIETEDGTYSLMCTESNLLEDKDGTIDRKPLYKEISLGQIDDSKNGLWLKKYFERNDGPFKTFRIIYELV